MSEINASDHRSITLGLFSNEGSDYVKLSERPWAGWGRIIERLWIQQTPLLYALGMGLRYVIYGTHFWTKKPMHVRKFWVVSRNSHIISQNPRIGPHALRFLARASWDKIFYLWPLPSVHDVWRLDLKSLQRLARQPPCPLRGFFRSLPVQSVQSLLQAEPHFLRLLLPPTLSQTRDHGSRISFVADVVCCFATACKVLQNLEDPYAKQKLFPGFCCFPIPNMCCTPGCSRRSWWPRSRPWSGRRRDVPDPTAPEARVSHESQPTEPCSSSHNTSNAEIFFFFGSWLVLMCSQLMDQLTFPSDHLLRLRVQKCTSESSFFSIQEVQMLT